jgi:hypothetical protein
MQSILFEKQISKCIGGLIYKLVYDPYSDNFLPIILASE